MIDCLKENLIALIKSILYNISEAEYNDTYSSRNYEPDIQAHKYSLAPLLTLAKSQGINIDDLKSSYCGDTVKASEFCDYEEIIAWF